MNHLTEEQLVDLRYGGLADVQLRKACEEHLAGCAACRGEYQALERVLAAVDAAPVPERDEYYGARVWQQIRPRLEERRRWDWTAWLAPRRLAAASAVAALVIAAFLLGRYGVHGVNVPGVNHPPLMNASETHAVRERILLVAVGDHLDRSQMVLLEVANADEKDAVGGTLDISDEQKRAGELVASNRLYRQTAEHQGDAAMANVLDDLERTLLEIAHSPSKPTGPQLVQLQQRIASKGLLLKVRVVGSEVREREKSAVQKAARSGS
jgi:anti-sigma factor RsiW